MLGWMGLAHLIGISSFFEKVCAMKKPYAYLYQSTYVQAANRSWESWLPDGLIRSSGKQPVE